jgi:hypothetical protein
MDHSSHAHSPLSSLTLSCAPSPFHPPPTQWTPGPFEVTGNQFFLSKASTVFVGQGPYGDSVDSVYPTVTVSNNINLTEPWKLNYTDPGTATPPAARLGFLANSYDGNNGNFRNFSNGVQIDPGVDDMRVAVDAPVGTVIAHAVANGSIQWVNSANLSAHVWTNPFAAGVAWSIIPHAAGFYGAPYKPLAPEGRYAIAPSGDITLAHALNDAAYCNTSCVGLDFIVVQVSNEDAFITWFAAWHWTFFL